MSSQVVTLYQDKAKTNALYPRTKLSAISDDDGKALSETISETIGELNSILNGNLLCPIPIDTVLNDITCKYNNDGTYTLNGTASVTTKFIIGTLNLVPGKQYKILGCPSGGGIGVSYRISGDGDIPMETGNGAIFTATTNIEVVKIVIDKDTAVNNLVFKPMITENLDLTYDDFQSFYDSYTKGISVNKFYGIDTNNLLATVKKYTSKIGYTEYTYNATQDCYILIINALSNSGNGKHITININGQTFVYETASSQIFQNRQVWTFPVKAGDEVYFKVYTNGSGTPLYFKVFGVR